MSAAGPRAATAGDEQPDLARGISHLLPDRTEEARELTIAGLLREVAAQVPDQPGLLIGSPDPDQRPVWSFAEMLREAERVAHSLLARAEPGEHVAIWAPNLPEWTFVEFGAALAGLTLVTVNPALREAEASDLIARADATLLIHGTVHRDNDLAALAPRVAARLPRVREAISLPALLAETPAVGALPEVDPGSAAQIQFTSGTTGKPKGVMLSHRAMVNSTRFSVGRMGAPLDSHVINPLPLFHTSGCGTGTLGPLWLRGCQVQLREYDPGLVLELIETYGATTFFTVPTILHRLLEHPDFERRDLSSLAAILTGGAVVPLPLLERTQRQLGCAVSISFGMTEFGSTITQTQPDDDPEAKTRTVGRPFPQMEVKVADPESGEPVALGERGEFCARGYQVMLGYYGDPAATAAVVDEQGWMHSGDLCTMDSRGYLSVVGRLKDVIIRGGENIAAREIEEHLLRHPELGDVAVIGVADEEWGEAVAAVLIPRQGAAPSAAALREHCAGGLARHKVPRHWFVAAALPMTPSGKVQKFRLKELAEAGELARAED